MKPGYACHYVTSSRILSVSEKSRRYDMFSLRVCLWHETNSTQIVLHFLLERIGILSEATGHGGARVTYQFSSDYGKMKPGYACHYVTSSRIQVYQKRGEDMTCFL